MGLSLLKLEEYSHIPRMCTGTGPMILTCRIESLGSNKDNGQGAGLTLWFVHVVVNHTIPDSSAHFYIFVSINIIITIHRYLCVDVR